MSATAATWKAQPEPPFAFAAWDEGDPHVRTRILFDMPSLTELRRQLAAEPACRIVSAAVFVERLTGHDHLVRADEPGANLLGLLDEATGARILVPLEELNRERLDGRKTARLAASCRRPAPTAEVCATRPR